MVGAILWLFAGILILAGIAVLGVLCTPLRLSLAFDTTARPTYLFRVAVFGGLLPVISTSGKRSQGSARKAVPRTAPRSRKPIHRHVADYAPRMLREGPKLMARMAARVRIEAVDASISFGLPDPADTGRVYGALSPVAHALVAGKYAGISLQPDFSGAVLAGRGRLAARLTPVALILPMLSFGWTVFVSPRLSGTSR